MPDPTFLPFCSIGLILVDFRLQQWRLSSICYSFFGGILNGSAQFIDGHELRTLPVLHFRGLRFTTLLWRPASAVTRYRGFVDTSPGCCIYAVDKIRHYVITENIHIIHTLPVFSIDQTLFKFSNSKFTLERRKFLPSSSNLSARKKNFINASKHHWK